MFIIYALLPTLMVAAQAPNLPDWYSIFVFVVVMVSGICG